MPKRKTNAKKVPKCKINPNMVEELYWDHNTPPKVIVHSTLVGRLAKSLAEQIAENKKLKLETSPDHLYYAGLLHDVAKNPKKRSNEFDPEHSWAGGRAVFQADKEVAKIAGYHDFLNIARKDLSFDQKLLIYCDLRIVGGKIVPLKTRIDSIVRKWKKSPRYKVWVNEVKEAKKSAYEFQRLLRQNKINVNPRMH